MARPNVSLEHIALALTALGTSAVLAACSRSAEPASNVRADQTQTQASGTAAAPPPPPVTTPAEDEPKLGAMKDSQGTPTASASASPMRRAPGGGGGGDKGTTGQASCGAGNCTAVPKKK